MPSLYSLELYAEDVLRDRRRQAALAALAAQLPRPPRAPRLDQSVRLRLAIALRALALRLDSCAAAEASLLNATSR